MNSFNGQNVVQTIIILFLILGIIIFMTCAIFKLFCTNVSEEGEEVFGYKSTVVLPDEEKLNGEDMKPIELVPFKLKSN